MAIGSIREKGKNRDGSYSYQLRVSINRRSYSETVRCASRAQAERALSRFVSRCMDSQVVAGSIAWPDLCQRWLLEYAAMKHKNSTYEIERRAVSPLIAPAFDKKAQKITRADVQAWVVARARVVGPKTVKNNFSLMHQIFAWAVKMEILSASPCDYIDLPKQKKPDPRYLDAESMPRFLAALDSEPRTWLRVLLSLAAFAGLRKGEILGLKWSDVDLASGSFSVVRTRMANIRGGGWYIDTPKSESSVRRGALPGVLVDLLREYKKEQDSAREKLGRLWPPGDWIVRYEDGTPVAPAAVSGIVSRFVRRYDLPPFSLHSLRHTHATLLLYLGADLEQIQRKLGHSDKATTSNIYVHLFEDFADLDRSSAAAIDSYVAGVKK